LPQREIEEVSLLLAFTVSIVDVRYLNLLSRFFWPIIDYITSSFSTPPLGLEGLALFESIMRQLVVFTIDLTIYFVIFYILIALLRRSAFR